METSKLERKINWAVVWWNIFCYTSGLVIVIGAAYMLVTLVMLGWPIWVNKQVADRYGIEVQSAQCESQMIDAIKVKLDESILKLPDAMPPRK